MGTVARIENRGNLPGGMPALVIRATTRAEVGLGVIGETSGLWVHASPVADDEVTDEVATKATELRAALRALFEALGGRRLTEVLRGVDDPSALADLAGWWPDLGVDRKIELLETLDLDASGRRWCWRWTKDALAEHELSEKIRNDVTEGLEDRQREFLLRQQMDAIRKELGEDDEDSVEGYRERLEALVEAGAVTAATAQGDRPRDRPLRAHARAERRARVDPQLARHRVRDPVGRAQRRRLRHRPGPRRARRRPHRPRRGQGAHRRDAGRAQAARRAGRRGRRCRGCGRRRRDARRRRPTTTTDDETGDDRTDEVGDGGDDTVVPLIAEVEPGDNGRKPGAIVALAGPPGVGKTSLGASVARALGRKFTRVALGGVRDEAEIRGHRRTYVGAQAGRIVRALQEAGTMNPVILLDEVDKVGADWRGDPSSALLEVLDPAQNHTFRDHYLEVDLDLSDVLFLATANVLETIPGPLLDRMEIIRLDGYTHDEKVAIARDHLFDRQRQRNGLREGEVEVTDAALRRDRRGLHP